MAAFSTKGMTVWLQKLGTGAPAVVTVTQITNSKPAVVTVGATDIAKFVDGNTVKVAGTGVAALDNHFFVVSALDDTDNTFALMGSDASSATAVITTGTVANYTGDMVEFCVAGLDRQQQPAAAISVGTTCDPSAQIAGEPEAGTLAVNGFVDYQKEGFLEFMRAVDDGATRVLIVDLPPSATTSGNGQIIFPEVTATGFSETFNVGAAATWTGEFTLGTRPEYRVS